MGRIFRNPISRDAQQFWPFRPAANASRVARRSFRSFYGEWLVRETTGSRDGDLFHLSAKLGITGEKQKDQNSGCPGGGGSSQRIPWPHDPQTLASGAMARRGPFHHRRIGLEGGKIFRGGRSGKFPRDGLFAGEPAEMNRG